MSRASECPVRWCDEVGEHGLHRRYVASFPVWRGAWLIGVNVARTADRHVTVELTATTRGGMPVVVPLEPCEAEPLGRALLEAVEHAGR